MTCFRKKRGALLSVYSQQLISDEKLFLLCKNSSQNFE